MTDTSTISEFTPAAEEILRFCREQYGVQHEFPWFPDDSAVLRHTDNRKWFALIMKVAENKFDKSSDSDTAVQIMNLKCDPVMIGALRRETGFYPAYHMSKEHWITVRLDGSVDCKRIKELVVLSYNLTKPKAKRMKKKGLSQ